VGATGAQATTMNLAGQGRIHRFAVVTTGPVGWLASGIVAIDLGFFCKRITLELLHIVLIASFDNLGGYQLEES
jgi:hypothetical protein